MCKQAYLRFAETVDAPQRLRAVELVLKNSWDLGNKDGIGLVTWNDGDAEADVSKALKLTELVIPPMKTNVLVHARKATCAINIENTHPMCGGGAYLVHNGIVHPANAEAAKELASKVKTTNDSELILKAYLGADRDLKAGLGKIGGWANVMLWDARRQVLSVFADGHAFHIFRQAGVLVIAQESEQVKELMIRGLGHHYEYDSLPADRVFEIHLDGTLGFVKALRQAAKVAREQKVQSGFAQSFPSVTWPAAEAVTAAGTPCTPPAKSSGRYIGPDGKTQMDIAGKTWVYVEGLGWIPGDEATRSEVKAANKRDHAFIGVVCYGCQEEFDCFHIKRTHELCVRCRPKNETRTP